MAAMPYYASGIAHQAMQFRRRSHRIHIAHKETPIEKDMKQREFSDDFTLTNPFCCEVKTLPDRALLLEERVIMNLHKSELLRQPSSIYFRTTQTELQPYHREQAVVWLADICKDMRCQPDVLPLGVNILDRYLSRKDVFPHKLQIVAGVCLVVASKLKSPKPIDANNLAYYSAGNIEVEHVLPYELSVLQTLNWDVAVPTSLDFYDHIVSRLPQIAVLKSRFCEIIYEILRNYKLATFLPSIQCGLALLAAAKRYSQALYLEISGLSPLSVLTIPAILGVDTELLHEILHAAESMQDVSDWVPGIDVAPRVYQVLFLF